MKVLQWLRELEFYLSRSKLDLFSDKTDCLGHVIDDNGIHAELDKMQWIREWRIPRNYNEVQKFLELVQYLALYMPDIMAYITLLSGSAQNNWTFQWKLLLDKCFQSIKAIARRSPILKPVDFNKNEPVWVITDGSWTGISVVWTWRELGVGLYWNVRIIDLNLSVGTTNPRRLNLIFIYIFISKIIIKNKRRLTPSVTVKHWGGEAGIAWFNVHIPCSGAWDTMISYTALISTPGMTCGKVLANLVPNGIKIESVALSRGDYCR